MRKLFLLVFIISLLFVFSNASAAEGKGRGKRGDKGDSAVKSRGKSEENRGREGSQGSIEEQIAHEEQKHAQRTERLQQLMDWAKQNNDDKSVDRIEHLMDKEQDRYQSKIEKLLERAVDVEQREIDKDK